VIRNETRGTVLATRETWALGAAERLRGLLDRGGLGDGEALVISPCTSVHMFGMKFAVDVIFVARDGTVVRAIPALKPWRATWIWWRARHCVEMPVGVLAATGTRAGDRLVFEPDPTL
jgi:uncharacterized membrane protein (UPF0127 family)